MALMDPLGESTNNCMIFILDAMTTFRELHEAIPQTIRMDSRHYGGIDGGRRYLYPPDL